MDKSNIKYVLGTRLKKLRGDRTQKEIVSDFNAKKLGIGLTAQSLGRYENNERKPDSEMVAALAHYYNVSTDYLLGLTDVETTDIQIQGVCKFTGLTENALNKLIQIKALSTHRSPFANDEKLFVGILNYMLESQYITFLIATLVDVFFNSAEIIINKEEIEATIEQGQKTNEEQVILSRYRASERLTRLLDSFDCNVDGLLESRFFDYLTEVIYPETEFDVRKE